VLFLWPNDAAADAPRLRYITPFTSKCDGRVPPTKYISTTTSGPQRCDVDTDYRSTNTLISPHLLLHYSSLLSLSSAFERTMEHHHMPSERPPSYSQFHDQQPHDMSSDPTPSDSSAVQHERALPSLPTAPAEAKFASEPVAESQFAWPSSNPLTAYYQPGPSKLSPKTKPSDSPKTMDVDTPDSRHWRGSSVLSMDDPDVRMAAQALGDLRAGMTSLHSHGDASKSFANIYFIRFCSVSTSA
jgi:hypothetical protein